MSSGAKPTKPEPDRLVDVLKQIQARKTVKPEDATRALQQYHKVQEHIKALKTEIEIFKANKDKAIQGQSSQANGSVSRKGSITSRSRINGINQQTSIVKNQSRASNTPRILNGPSEITNTTSNKESKLPTKVDADKSTGNNLELRGNKARPEGSTKHGKGNAPMKEEAKVNGEKLDKTNGENNTADRDKELAKLRFQNAQMRVTLDKRNSISSTTAQGIEPGKGFIVPLKAFPAPEKLVEEFKRIHDMEWRSAFHDLDKHYKLKEENITELLGAIAKEAYNFCQASERQQFEDVKKSHVHLTDVLVQPKYAPQTRDMIIAKSKSIIEKDGFQVTRRFLREYRRAMARVPIPGLTEIFEHLVQKDVISKHTSLRITPKSTRPYIQKLVEVNWLMALQEPPMTQVWPRGGQLMNREWFAAYSKKGATIIHAVWPALFIHKEGSLAEKGICLVK